MALTDWRAGLRRGVCALLALILMVTLLPALAAEPTHGVLTGDKVLFRKTVTGSDYWDRLDTGWVIKTLSKVDYDNYAWYKAEATTPTSPNRVDTGYIRADFVRMLTVEEEAAWLKTKQQPFLGLTPVVSDPGTVTSPPGESTTPSATSGTLRITKTSTNLRKEPGGLSLWQYPIDTVLPFTGAPVFSGGYYWSYVTDTARNLKGYVRSDCYVIVSGAQATPAPTTGTATANIRITLGKTNLREAPGGTVLAVLERNAILPYFGVPTAQGGYNWVYAYDNVSKQYGYVRSDCYAFVSGTPVPVVTPVPVDNTAQGYIITTKSEINLRKTAQVNAPVLGKVDIRQVYALNGVIQSSGGYSWYPVTVNGQSGYLRGDCARLLTNTELIGYLNNGQIPSTTNPAPGGQASTGYVVTTIEKVYIRATASQDARTLTLVEKEGTAFPLLSTITSGGRLWYKVSYQNQEGFILGSVSRMMTNAEYIEYIKTQPTPVPTAAPTAIPPLSELSSTALTSIEKVIIRSAATTASKNLAIIYKMGTVVALRGQSTLVGKDTWYTVRVNGINGWIRGDLLRILTKEEEAALNAGGDPGAPTPASYRTLQLGSSGEDVTRLQNELNRLGLLNSAYVTGTYNSETASAVRAYQQNNGLTVDGIAGSNTQHKIYGTVPEGTVTPGGGSTVTPTLNPVEMVDWYKGDINAFWGRGEVAIMTDVRTGISLRIKRWAGAYHMDGEPLTAADTAALNKIYGVSSAQQILEKNLYQRRSVWITLKGRTFAASLYGVPHNYPAGDTIANNNFNGQLCVHFYNSRTHTSGSVDSDHMKAIRYAYDTAPSRK